MLEQRHSSTYKYLPIDDDIARGCIICIVVCNVLSGIVTTIPKSHGPSLFFYFLIFLNVKFSSFPDLIFDLIFDTNNNRSSRHDY